jgi:hypothetical protein
MTNTTAPAGAAVDLTLRRIVTDLHGDTLYTWAVTVYLLTATISGPIYGKLSDLFGRRRLRRDLRATEIDHAVVTSDAPLVEKLAWLGVVAAGDRARAALDRERAAHDRVDAARERVVLEGALRGRRPFTR